MVEEELFVVLMGHVRGTVQNSRGQNILIPRQPSATTSRMRRKGDRGWWKGKRSSQLGLRVIGCAKWRVPPHFLKKKNTREGVQTKKGDVNGKKGSKTLPVERYL